MQIFLFNHVLTKKKVNKMLSLVLPQIKTDENTDCEPQI